MVLDRQKKSPAVPAGLPVSPAVAAGVPRPCILKNPSAADRARLTPRRLIASAANG